MEWLHSFARRIFGEYSFYRIYGAEPGQIAEPNQSSCVLGQITDVCEIDASEDPALRALVQYGGEEALVFGAWLDGKLAAVCSLWF